MTQLQIIQDHSFTLAIPDNPIYKSRLTSLLNRPITLQEIYNYIDTKKLTWKPATLSAFKNSLSNALKNMSNDIKYRVAIDEMMKRFKVSKPDKKVYKDITLKRNDIEKIYDNSTKRTSLIIKMLVDTGLRVSELLSLKHSECKIENEYVYISLIGKGKKVRRVFIPLIDYENIKNVFNSKVFLFESKQNKKLSRLFIYKIVRLAGEKINKRISPHTLRHTFATFNLVEKGKSLKSISNYLGHSSTSITADMYIHDDLKPSDLF